MQDYSFALPEIVKGMIEALLRIEWKINNEWGVDGISTIIDNALTWDKGRIKIKNDK
jgi:hypothetical protein